MLIKAVIIQNERQVNFYWIFIMTMAILEEILTSPSIRPYYQCFPEIFKAHVIDFDFVSMRMLMNLVLVQNC